MRVFIARSLHQTMWHILSKDLSLRQLSRLFGKVSLAAASPLSNPEDCAQFELGGGRPLARVTCDRWCGSKLLRNPSAKQLGRDS